MNKIILLFMLLFASTTTMAQDVIVKRDGRTILSKVLEVGDTTVKYKSHSNLDGPVYTIQKTDILSINYENGDKDVFDEVTTTENIEPEKQISNTDFSIESNNKLLEGINNGNLLQKEKLMANAKSWNTVGKVCLWAGILGGIGTGLLIYDPDSDNVGTAMLGWGCVFVPGLVGCFVCQSIAKNKMEAAESIQVSHLFMKDFNVGNSNLTAGIDILNNRMMNDKTIGLGLTYSF